MVTITIDQLRKAGACGEALNKLRARYGDKRTFRKPETLAKALAKTNRLVWFTLHMLDFAGWEEYGHLRDTLRSEYRDKRSAAAEWLDLESNRGRKEYDRRRNKLQKEFKYGCALAAARLYFQQETS